MERQTRRRTGNVAIALVPPLPAPSAESQLLHHDIARRAFELYCDRGCEHGHDLDDWFAAERELRDAAALSTV